MSADVLTYSLITNNLIRSFCNTTLYYTYTEYILRVYIILIPL